MLYLDSSVLVKRYVREKGSDAVLSRFEREEPIYTSVLSFAEVHAAIWKKRELSAGEKRRLIEEFQTDWFFSLNILELTAVTMAALPSLCEQYSLEDSLRAGDAIQLSAAIWLRDAIRMRAKGFESSVKTFEFGVSDRQLGKVAAQCGFRVFDPTLSAG